MMRPGEDCMTAMSIISIAAAVQRSIGKKQNQCLKCGAQLSAGCRLGAAVVRSRVGLRLGFHTSTTPLFLRVRVEGEGRAEGRIESPPAVSGPATRTHCRAPLARPADQINGSWVEPAKDFRPIVWGLGKRARLPSILNGPIVSSVSCRAFWECFSGAYCSAQFCSFAFKRAGVHAHEKAV